jgi:type VI secretion system protein ImpH
MNEPTKPTADWSSPVVDYLFAQPYDFDFFQAVRLLERLNPGRVPVGKGARPDLEVVRFKTWQSLNFPASSIYGLDKPAEPNRPAPMVITFMGMTGSSGVLPRIYTERILQIIRDVRGPERYSLRDWLDLFSHRFISLFFRAWEKYRYYIPFERGEFRLRDPDTFTRSLLSLVGLGTGSMRDRLRAALREDDEELPREKLLAKVDDLSILGFGGFFSHRPRNALSLAAMLSAFVRLPVKVCQFQGQWLRLDPGNQSRMGKLDGNNCLGRNVIVGDRIWDVQSKIRVQIGPMSYAQFLEYLPDPAPRPERKALFLLAQVVRLYVGPEVDVEFQLILAAAEVPSCKVGRGVGIGPRLGWNTWSHKKAMPRDADDAVFQSDERVHFGKTIKG